MKQYLLAGTSALALLVGAAGADATTFNFSGEVVDFTMPMTGTYDITAAGAEGGGRRPEAPAASGRAPAARWLWPPGRCSTSRSAAAERRRPGRTYPAAAAAAAALSTPP